jgi:hypothetical protein
MCTTTTAASMSEEFLINFLIPVDRKEFNLLSFVISSSPPALRLKIKKKRHHMDEALERRKFVFT